LDNKTITEKLQDIYKRLFDAYGPQHWWPADEPFEVMVGAVLTQSVAWTNVERALNNLKAAGILSPQTIQRLSADEIAPLIRPCIYYNVKARKLKALVEWFYKNYLNDFKKLFAADAGEIRESLLSVWGIGEETADSIVLYTAGKPVFVIDAYTRRIIDRTGFVVDGSDYGAYQALFMDNLPADSGLFNEYHALLVNHGKNICRTKPLCEQCCLRDICGSGQAK